MKNLTLEHIAQACRGQYRGPEEKKDKEAAAIFTDSRKWVPGDSLPHFFPAVECFSCLPRREAV